MTTLHTGPDSIYDVLGIGFGPSNLALAIAIEEHNAHAGRRTGCGSCSWNASRGSAGTAACSSTTPRCRCPSSRTWSRCANPTSDFSFLSYLHERGRLVDFINQKTLFPLRIEFHDYLEWAAARVADLVDYGREVVAVGRSPRTARSTLLRRRSAAPPATRSGHRPPRPQPRASAAGLEPHLPAGAALSDRVWHNQRAAAAGRPAWRRDRRGRFVVVGAGQSAAEAVDVPAPQLPRRRGLRGLRPLRLHPRRRQPVRQPDLRPGAVDLFYSAPPRGEADRSSTTTATPTTRSSTST